MCPFYRWENRDTKVMYHGVGEPGCEPRWSGPSPSALNLCITQRGSRRNEFSLGKAREGFLEEVMGKLECDR